MGQGPEQAEAELLRAYLAVREAECPGCGYDLKDLRGSRCPECGQPLVLRVGLEFPRMRLWVAGLIGLAAGAGLNGLLLIYGMIRLVFSGGPGLRFLLEFMGHNFVGVLLQGGALAVWLKAGRRIRRMEDRKRGWLCATCWGLTLVNILVFTVLID